MSTYLIKKVPVHKQRVVWLGQLPSQEGEETADLGGSEVRVVHHYLLLKQMSSVSINAQRNTNNKREINHERFSDWS